MSDKLKSIHPKFVAIKASELFTQAESPLKKSEQTQDQIARKQNIGVIQMMGNKCDPWITVGDTVSFYRNAATTVPWGGEEFLLVHEDHILVSFINA